MIGTSRRISSIEAAYLPRFRPYRSSAAESSRRNATAFDTPPWHFGGLEREDPLDVSTGFVVGNRHRIAPKVGHDVKHVWLVTERDAFQEEFPERLLESTSSLKLGQGFVICRVDIDRTSAQIYLRDAYGLPGELFLRPLSTASLQADS